MGLTVWEDVEGMVARVTVSVSVLRTRGGPR